MNGISWLGQNPVAASQHTAVGMLTRPPAWTERALCTALSPASADLALYPDHGPPTDRVRQMCRACPVQVRCLDAGMNEEHGVWGGLSPAERDQIRPVYAGPGATPAA